MTDLPEPLTTTTDDVAGLDGFMLDTHKLMSSELWALADGEEFKAAIGLWCRAWTQTPAGSLPNDDRVLAAFSGAGPRWRKVKAMALRGFVECSDGRLYHKTLCEDVKRAAEAKRKRAERTKAATEARKKERDGQRNVERNVEQNRNVTKSHRRDETRQEDKIDEIGSARDPLVDLEAMLRSAAGWQSEPAPRLCVTGPMQALIDQGVDLDLDMLPTVKSLAPTVRSRASWKYFEQPCLQARDARLAAITAANAPPQETRRHASSPSTGRSTFELIAEAAERSQQPSQGDAGEPGAGDEIYPPRAFGAG